MANSFKRRCWLGARYIAVETWSAACRHPGKAALIGLALMIAVADLVTPTQPKQRPINSAASEIRQRPAVYNSEWDGSVSQVERYLRNNLKDPGSFEAIAWGNVIDSENVFSVWCKYRAKNGFGGYVIESKQFIMDRAGTVVKVQPISIK